MWGVCRKIVTKRGICKEHAVVTLYEGYAENYNWKSTKVQTLGMHGSANCWAGLSAISMRLLVVSR